MKSAATLPTRPGKGVPPALAHALGVDVKDLTVQGRSTGADLTISGAGHTFVVEFRSTSAAGQIATAVEEVLRRARARRHSVPVIAAPFMGEVARQRCDTAGVSWIDLSGNARIVAPRLRVIVDGQPNKFPRAGRPANVFAPKSARIIRWMLIHPREPFLQHELATATGLGEGFVSRIVGKLVDEGYLTRAHGAVEIREHDLVLDAWRETHQLDRRTVTYGHIAQRSSEAMLRSVSDLLRNRGVEHAATGLAAAWQYTTFAAYRTATVYVSDDVRDLLTQALAFREEERGANLWLVTPTDSGVFAGATEVGGIRCVHPVQAYIDLKEEPERADEAAARLRTELLTWNA